jgi:peptide subunit release factor 1 (eRF1)
VEALQDIVHRDDIRHIFLLGDEVIVSMLKDQLPTQLAERVHDVLRVDMSAPERKVFERTLKAMTRQDSLEDAARVRELIDEYCAGGLAVSGMHDTLEPLLKGQVSELLISSDMQTIEEDEEPEESTLALLDYDLPPAGDDPAAREERRQKMIDALITQARQSGAVVRFVEDTELLKRLGGVGAFLRYRV